MKEEHRIDRSLALLSVS